MDERGEQGTVVFALIVTEPASECVCGRGRKGAAKRRMDRMEGYTGNFNEIS